MKEIIKLFRELNYKKVSNEDKLKLLDKVEIIVNSKDKVYRGNYKQLKGFTNIFINEKGYVFNTLTSSKVNIPQSKSKRNMRLGGIKNIDLALIYYEMFIGKLPLGYYIHSKSKKFLLNKDDLYINNKTHFENELKENEFYGQVSVEGCDYFITTEGRAYSLVSKRFLTKRESKSLLMINGKNYFIGYLLKSAIDGNPNKYSDIIFLDGDYSNYNLDNLILVKDSLKYQLQEDEDYKYLPNKSYVITSLGRVFCNTLNTWREIKQQTNSKGYKIITLPILKGKNGKTWRVHRLVMQFYMELDIEAKEINHIDENKQNNSVDNLEVIEGNENYICYKINSIMNNGKKLSWDEINELYILIKSNLTSNFNLYTSNKDIQKLMSRKDFVNFTEKCICIRERYK